MKNMAEWSLKEEQQFVDLAQKRSFFLMECRQNIESLVVSDLDSRHREAVQDVVGMLMQKPVGITALLKPLCDVSLGDSV